jgi:transglutaminase-like putative cysteine protease
MKRIISISAATALILVLVLLVAGCTSGPATTAKRSNGDALLAQGEKEFTGNNMHAAFRLFSLAQENYTAAGNAIAAKTARDRASIARMLTLEFPYNRSQIDEMIAARFPDVPADRKASWLPCEASQCIESDGETWYPDKTISNIQYHNLDIMRNMTAAKGGTPFYDQLVPYAFAPAQQGGSNYINPIRWEGTGVLSIPKDRLPASGPLHLWIPLPIETDSQRDVAILSVEPARYVKSQSGTQADIGFAYLEIPLEQVTEGGVNVSVKFRFTAYEQRFVIDPEKVGKYDPGDPEYIRYTAPSRNVALTPDLRQEALTIVGNETNPYRKAQKIYWHVISRPYTLPPYARILANSTPQPMTEYVRTTGYGDCGAQSAYFAALCRAAGIPARAIGGQQMIPGYGGVHIWSEYYLPGYGWIPNDVTVAEGAEWSYSATDAERQQYRQYFSENLDPYRYIIQKDADLPYEPDPQDLTMSDMFSQLPKGRCDTCTVDPNFWIPEYWKVTITQV